MVTVSNPPTESTELSKFRAECRAWLLQHCPAELIGPHHSSEGRCWGGKRWVFESPAQRLWLERAAAKGWTVPHWPLEYGGAGLSRAERGVIAEEMQSLGMREPLYSYGITMLGPALLKFGSPGQKAAHLPKIARGEIRWCQGYSEPNAGSDLASLATKCEDRGDHWLVNGQKIWTSKADESDWIFAMVRTSHADKKQDGITFILIDMASPGITVRPIKLISGRSPFCEVFFDNVQVPKYYGPDNASVVGELGQGWRVGTYLLTHERSSLGGYTLNGSSEEQPILQAAKQKVGVDGSGRLANTVLRARLAAALIDDAACTALSEKLNAEAGQGNELGARSSLVKYASTKIIKEGYEIRMAFGDLDTLKKSPQEDEEYSLTARNWLYSRAYTILGGTSEIQLNIISKRLLHLPSR
ncbi:MAG: acyl-CoA dehydrogenase family protein [Pseudomonadota bacterium]